MKKYYKFIKTLFLLLIFVFVTLGCSKIEMPNDQDAPVYFFPQEIEYDGPLFDLSFLEIIPYGSYGEGNPYRGTGGAFYVEFDPSNGKGRVIDGDTTTFWYPTDIYNKITTSAKSTRYFNMDTPETRPAGKEEPWGHLATLYVSEMLQLAEQIILQTDPGDNFLDKYGRFLAWVWIRLPDEENFYLLNYMVVRQGLGSVRYLFGAGETEVTVYNDWTYTQWMQFAEKKAKEDKYGIHSKLLDYYWDYNHNQPFYQRMT